MSNATTAQPLVLVPGLLCDALLWAPQIDALAGIADAWVPAPTQHATVEDLARAVLAASAQRRELVARSQAEGLGAVAEALLPRLVWPQAPRHAALHAVVRSMARNVGAEAFVRQQEAIIGRPDPRAALRNVACPTLVACGAQDILTPPAAHEEIAALVPGARLQLFPDCGHLSTLEQPAVVNQALRDWLLGR